MSLVDMPEGFYEYLESLSKGTLLNVMVNAVDEMQGYSGQTVTHAIASALGAEIKEDDEGRHSYRLPTRADIENSSVSGTEKQPEPAEQVKDQVAYMVVALHGNDDESVCSVHSNREAAEVRKNRFQNEAIGDNFLIRTVHFPD